MSPATARGAWMLLQRFADAHSRHGEIADALGFRLGAGRGRALLRLSDGPRTMSQLAGDLGFDAPYTTLVVDKLVAHGLVERTADPADRRRRPIALTDAGRTALATVDAIRGRPPRALAALAEADLSTLAGLLARLSAADEAPPE